MLRVIDEIRLAWVSISRDIDTPGWKTVAVLKEYPGRFRAGRNIPEGNETLLASFRVANFPRAQKLPESIGFIVTRVDATQDGLIWLALTKTTNGNLELFSAMVSDVVQTALNAKTGDESFDLNEFLNRVRAWQEFMRKGAAPLSSAEEIGLAGELTLLGALLALGLSPSTVVTAWVGPVGGIQDFKIGQGAIEVKGTVSSRGFVASISSLEQLDDSICNPLYLCGVKFMLADVGLTIPQMISRTIKDLGYDGSVVTEFNNKLLSAGYWDAHADHYERSFALVKLVILDIDDQFPRLTLGDVKPGVISARYEINIEQLIYKDVGLDVAIRKLGII
jgi:hypothetical protein